MQIIADHEYQNLSCCHSFGTVKLYWLENEKWETIFFIELYITEINIVEIYDV
jgi:hypothetical protein